MTHRRAGIGGKASRLCLSFSCLEWGCPSRLSRTTEKLASLHYGFSACLSPLPSPADQMLHSLAVSLATTANLLTASLLETSWKGKDRADVNICMQHSCNSAFFNQAQLSASPFRKSPGVVHLPCPHSSRPHCYSWVSNGQESTLSLKHGGPNMAGLHTVPKGMSITSLSCQVWDKRAPPSFHPSLIATISPTSQVVEGRHREVICVKSHSR